MSGYRRRRDVMFNLRTLLRRTGDPTILIGMLSKIWPAGAGLVTLILITSKFSPVQQGYHLTFQNLVGMSVFFELGLSQVIVQFVSHEMVGVRLGRLGVPEGDSLAIARLASIARFSLNWFLTAAVLMAVLLSIGGVLFFSSQPSDGIHWLGPWLLLCLAASIDLLLIPIQAILQGCDRFRDAYLYRLGRTMASSVSLWLAMSFGAGLWSAGIALSVGCCIGSSILMSRHRGLFLSLLRHARDHSVDWKREMLPLQWRIALSWLSGYFIFSLFTPLAFHFEGPVVAGRVGLTLALVNTISSIAMTWSEARQPRFGMLIASRRWRELDRAAMTGGAFSLGTAILGALALFALMLILPRMGFSITTRALPPGQISFFVATMLINCVIFAQAFYLRAHKAEPFVWLSVGNAVLVAATVAVGEAFYGTPGMGVAYFLSMTLVILPWATAILVRFRSRYHQDQLMVAAE
jgi:hypothetical protein